MPTRRRNGVAVASLVGWDGVGGVVEPAVPFGGYVGWAAPTGVYCPAAEFAVGTCISFGKVVFVAIAIGTDKLAIQQGDKASDRRNHGVHCKS